MKILYLALVELEVYNAPRTHTIEVCENLTNLGHDVLLLIPRPWKEKQTFPFRVTYVPFWGWGIFRELLFNIVLGFYFIYSILKFKPDVIYERMLHNPICRIISKIFKKKHCIEVNGPPLANGIPFKNSLTKIELRKADGIIIPSPTFADIIVKDIKINQDKIQFIPNGVNPEKFYPQDTALCRRILQMDEEAFYIGYAGGIYWAYDLDFVLRAFKKIQHKLKHLKLIIAGAPAGHNQPENVLFIKSTEYAKLPLLINSFNVCLLPLSEQGIKETKGFMVRTKLFEYIACGKMVLMPTLGSEYLPEIFKNFIIFYKHADEDDFLGKIGELYHNSNTFEVKREEVYKFVQEYDWKATAKKIIEFVESLT